MNNRIYKVLCILYAGKTSLMYAVESRNYVSITLNYIMYKVTNILYLGRTSLMYAAKRGNTDTVKIILEHRADVHIKNKDG